MKRKTHKYLLLFGFLAFGGLIKAQSLSVVLLDGQENPFEIENTQSISFPNKSLQVNLKNGEYSSFALSETSRIVFSTVINEVEKITKENLIRVYPNPVVDLLHINLSQSDVQSGKLTVRSIDGKMIYASHVSLSENNLSINVSDWAKGVYVVFFESGDRRQIEKVIKQ